MQETFEAMAFPLNRIVPILFSVCFFTVIE